MSTTPAGKPAKSGRRRVWTTRIVSIAALTVGGWLAGTQLSGDDSPNDLATTDTTNPADVAPVVTPSPSGSLPTVIPVPATALDTVPATLPLVTVPPATSPPATPPPTTPPTAPPTAPPAANTISCTNDLVGFSIDYPASWYTNDGGDPWSSCTWFDPRPFDPTADTEVDVAISSFYIDYGLDQMVEWELDPAFAFVLDYRETIVDGRRAVVAHVEYNGDGYYPNGWHGYLYLIDWDGYTFELITVGMPTTTFPSHTVILDEMAASLRLGVPPT